MQGVSFMLCCPKGNNGSGTKHEVKKHNHGLCDASEPHRPRTRYLMLLEQTDGPSQRLAVAAGLGERLVLGDPGELQVHVVVEAEQLHGRLQLTPALVQGLLQGLKPAQRE